MFPLYFILFQTLSSIQMLYLFDFMLYLTNIPALAFVSYFNRICIVNIYENYLKTFISLFGSLPYHSLCGVFDNTRFSPELLKIISKAVFIATHSFFDSLLTCNRILVILIIFLFSLAILL